MSYVEEVINNIVKQSCERFLSGEYALIGFLKIMRATIRYAEDNGFLPPLRILIGQEKVKMEGSNK